MLEPIRDLLDFYLDAVDDTVELVEEDRYEPVGNEDTDLMDSHGHAERHPHHRRHRKEKSRIRRVELPRSNYETAKFGTIDRSVSLRAR
jgi:hypothetical protein